MNLLDAVIVVKDIFLRMEIKMTVNKKTYEAGELVAYVEKLEKENTNLNANLKVLIKYELNIAKLEIEKLEKENAELKERCSILDKSLITSTKNNIERQKIIDEIKEQLTKAEEIILKLSTCLEGHSNNNFEYNLLQEAKQFLKEE